MELRWGIQDTRSAGPSAGRRGGELMGEQAGGLFTPAQCSHPPEGAADSCLLSTPDVPAPFPPWASGSPDAGPSAGGHDCEFSVWKCLLSYVLVVISTERGSRRLAKRKSHGLVSSGMSDLQTWLLVTQHPILCVAPGGHSIRVC